MTQQQRNEASDGVLKVIEAAIDEASTSLREVSLQLWNNPEIMFEEKKSAETLCSWLETRGWSVNRGAYGIPTAFEARFTAVPGGRTVCFNAEYDALPDIGHACGHNLIAISSLASGIGVAATLKTFSIPGTVVIMGTPAEETGGGKYIMANHGAWKDVDVCLMSHGMPQASTPFFLTKASWKFRAKFYGQSSHAAAVPWKGRNACDAIVLAYNGLALLRQHIQKNESIQSVIVAAGKAPNVIPPYSEGSYSIRGPNRNALVALRERVTPIFEGAAAATGCTVELLWDSLYEDILSNRTLAECYRKHMIKDLGMQEDDILTLEQVKSLYDQTGSSDMGNCTYICPGIQALFAINADDMPHTAAFREASSTEYAHKEAMRAGKAHAFVGIDALTDDAFYANVRQEWEEAMKKAGRVAV